MLLGITKGQESKTEGGYQVVSCDCCGKKLAKGEEFVVVGKYPVSWKALLSRGTLPEDFGKLYHKACFVESLEKERDKP